ncbi:hypothetical protein D1Y84_03480 [Acidipila sp. EB88]|nr:hypothetical protein D1Y84_03480 [Acidipila sp. EB88]
MVDGGKQIAAIVHLLLLPGCAVDPWVAPLDTHAHPVSLEAPTRGVGLRWPESATSQESEMAALLSIVVASPALCRIRGDVWPAPGRLVA